MRKQFFEELASVLDKMHDKQLIRHMFIDPNNKCCAIGAMLIWRGVTRAKLISEPIRKPCETPAIFLGCDVDLIKETISSNDGDFTPEERWEHMKNWAEDQLK